MKNNKGLAVFLKDKKVTRKQLAQITGYNKNTMTRWFGLESDESIPQGFILKMLDHFPNAHLEKYFPTHAQILAKSNRSRKSQ